MICLSLLQALVQNREGVNKKKKPGVFLPVCIQGKCSMSKGGIYYVPKEKHSPDDENMIGRPG